MQKPSVRFASFLSPALQLTLPSFSTPNTAKAPSLHRSFTQQLLNCRQHSNSGIKVLLEQTNLTLMSHKNKKQKSHRLARQMQGTAKGWMIHRLKKGQNDRSWPRYLFLRLSVKLEGFILQNTRISHSKIYRSNQMLNKTKLVSKVTWQMMLFSHCSSRWTVIVLQNCWVVGKDRIKWKKEKSWALGVRKQHSSPGVCTPAMAWFLSPLKEKHLPHPIMYSSPCVFNSHRDQKAYCLTLSYNYSPSKQKMNHASQAQLPLST